MFEGPEKKFQRHIADYFIREHRYALLGQDEITVCWGRPLKGLSREKTPLPQEKTSFFSLTLQLLSSRS
jgi:hypothetical protein